MKIINGLDFQSCCIFSCMYIGVMVCNERKNIPTSRRSFKKTLSYSLGMAFLDIPGRELFQRVSSHAQEYSSPWRPGNPSDYPPTRKRIFLKMYLIKEFYKWTAHVQIKHDSFDYLQINTEFSSSVLITFCFVEKSYAIRMCRIKRPRRNTHYITRMLRL